MKKRINKKILTGILSLSLITTLSISIFASFISESDWANIRTEFNKVVLAPGANDSEVNFAWYAIDNGIPEVEIVKSTEEFSGLKTYKGTSTIAYNDSEKSNQYYSKKVTVTDIEADTEYKYRYRVNDGNWSDTYEYVSKDTSSNLQFIAVGDPQIGIGVGGSKSDTERWNNTLQLATQSAPNAKFIFSMGDQVDANQEYDQYAGFLNPTILRSLPIATIQGNHDCDVPNYTWHFNNPNMTTYGETNAGGDYYFTSGDALFISLNSNAVLKSSKSDNVIATEHRKCIEEAINSNPYAKWRIVAFHQDIYGYPDHYDDAEVTKCREQLYPIIDDYDIDVVLTGHGHNYTRSYQMENNKPVSTEDIYNTNNVEVSSPSGTVYFELNTSASKNYENNKAGSNEHIAKSFAENLVQSYSVVNINSNSFEIKSYRTDTNEVYDTYKITKTDRTKLDQAIEKAEQIINSGSYNNEQLKNLKSQLTQAKLLTDKITRKEAYDAAVLLENAIVDIRPLMYGDINQNGEVAINDVILLKKYIANTITLTDKQLLIADVNHDGNVTVEDANVIEKYLAKLISTLD